ncbi:MAG: DUF3500 domain-containing protein [Planctomycetota bacterium]|nr:DUF3500 domain-containing protein [Planctomycetota bacterium]
MSSMQTAFDHTYDAPGDTRMSLRRYTYLAVCLALTAGIVGFAFNRTVATAPSMTTAATQWLETLDADQKESVLFDYDAPQRVGWHFIPKETRKGLAIRDMNDAQKEAATKLLSSCLSNVGYRKAKQIMALEALLGLLQSEAGGRGPERDPTKYYFTIFGTPQSGARWGLSIEGHHLSLNFVVEGDDVVSSSPTFFATNPTIVNRFFKDADGGYNLLRGERVINHEELLAFDLVNSLNEEQLADATIAEKAPAEIRNAGEPHAPKEEPVGINYNKLDRSQQSRLLSLVRAYAGNLPRDVSTARLKEIQSAGWKNVKFAWAGALAPGIGHYYRIEGPTFLIEFVNTQPDAEGNPASHIHCVWRDPRGDFALSAGE